MGTGPGRLRTFDPALLRRIEFVNFSKRVGLLSSWLVMKINGLGRAFIVSFMWLFLFYMYASAHCPLLVQILTASLQRPYLCFLSVLEDKARTRAYCKLLSSKIKYQKEINGLDWVGSNGLLTHLPWPVKILLGPPWPTPLRNCTHPLHWTPLVMKGDREKMSLRNYNCWEA